MHGVLAHETGPRDLWQRQLLSLSVTQLRLAVAAAAEAADSPGYVPVTTSIAR